MSNAAEVLQPIPQEDTSFHVSLGDCLTGEARNRLLSLRLAAVPESTELPATPEKSDPM